MESAVWSVIEFETQTVLNYTLLFDDKELLSDVSTLEGIVKFSVHH